MRKIIYLLFLVVTFMACNKDGNRKDSFECRIGNENYEINGDFAYAVKFSGGDIAIYGIEDPTLEDARALYVTLDEPPVEKTYQLGRDKDGHGYYTDNNGTFTFATVYENASGQIEILEVSDDRIKGEFNFTALNDNGETLNISNGKFDVAFRD